MAFSVLIRAYGRITFAIIVLGISLVPLCLLMISGREGALPLFQIVNLSFFFFLLALLAWGGANKGTGNLEVFKGFLTAVGGNLLIYTGIYQPPSHLMNAELWVGFMLLAWTFIRFLRMHT